MNGLRGRIIRSLFIFVHNLYENNIQKNHFFLYNVEEDIEKNSPVMKQGVCVKVYV